jgi:phosphatidylserine/phosphatidylglycerophosphate/cardiolipin synthase-like enzyme
MVVMPTPERTEMVPRTYDTVKALGQADSMPNQDQQIEEELKAYAQDQARQASEREQARRQGVPMPPAQAAGAPSRPDEAQKALSPLAQSAKDVGDKANVAKTLNALGIRTLIASLWTFNHDWRATEREQARLRELLPADAADAPARQNPPPATASQRYREIYIHSKLMVIDDCMFTLGSANLNLRSMAVDAEMNVASDDPQVSADLRQRVWAQHTGGAEGCNPGVVDRWTMKEAFDKWVKLIAKNRELKDQELKDQGIAPTGFLFPFEDKRTSRIRVG